MSGIPTRSPTCARFSIRQRHPWTRFMCRLSLHPNASQQCSFVPQGLRPPVGPFRLVGWARRFLCPHHRVACIEQGRLAVPRWLAHHHTLDHGVERGPIPMSRTRKLQRTNRGLASVASDFHRDRPRDATSRGPLLSRKPRRARWHAPNIKITGWTYRPSHRSWLGDHRPGFEPEFPDSAAGLVHSNSGVLVH